MRRYALFAVAICLLGTGTGAHSAEQSVIVSAATPGVPSQPRFWLSLTKDEAKLRADWEQSAASPRIETITEARAGDQLSTVIVFDGCQENALGNCDLIAQFAMQTPDGKRVEAGSGHLWSSKPLIGRLMLGAASATLPVGGSWPAGRYAVLATVTDRVASRSLGIQVAFEVTR